jgi:hypothetical protein
LVNSFQPVFFLSPYHLQQLSLFNFPAVRQITPAHDVRSALTGMYDVSHFDWFLNLLPICGYYKEEHAPHPLNISPSFPPSLQ